MIGVYAMLRSRAKYVVEYPLAIDNGCQYLQDCCNRSYLAMQSD